MRSFLGLLWSRHFAQSSNSCRLPYCNTDDSSEVHVGLIGQFVLLLEVLQLCRRRMLSLLLLQTSIQRRDIQRVDDEAVIDLLPCRSLDC